MNTPANAIPDVPLRSHLIASAEVSQMRQFYWLVRREFWEYRSLYIAPLAVASVFLFGFVISLFSLPGKMRTTSAMGAMLSSHMASNQQHKLIREPYDTVSFLLMGVSFIVALYFSLESMQSERRDRSVLFWKSLPVSDLMTVLAKASIPILFLQLITTAVMVVTQIIMLLLSSTVVAASGGSLATLWANLPLLSMWWMLLAHLIGGHGLWYAPVYGWLMLVSAWSRRAAILWAVLPVLAIGFIEKIAFNTSYFITMLSNRLVGAPNGGQANAGSAGSMESMLHMDPANFVMSPGLWIGLALTAAFLAGAVRLRRSQGPI